MKKSLMVGFVVNALACAAGDTGQSVDSHVADVGQPAIKVAAVRASFQPDPLQDTLALYRVRDLKVHGDSLVLVDRNDRVVFLDADLIPVRSFGRSGSGAGDLSQPDAVAISSGTVVIAETGNARASVFSLEGEFVRTVPLPARRTASVAVNSAGHIFVPVPSQTHYVEKVTPEGTSETWAERPEAREPEPGLPSSHPGYPADFIAMAPGDTLYVLDGREAEFLTYDPVGRLVARTTLPEPLRTRILEGTGVFVEGTAERGSVRFIPAFTDLELNHAGQLIAVPSRRPELSGLVALVFDPATTAVRVIEESETEQLPSASALFYEDALIVVTHDGEIYEFAVSG